MDFRFWILATWLTAAICAPGVAADLSGLERIEVYPPSFELSSARAECQLVVTGHFAGGETRDLTREAKFEANDVVAIDGSLLRAKKDGESTVTARVGNSEAIAKITVRNSQAPDPIRLTGEVLPVLTKQGCNAGSCHGSPEGKNGFALSLLAYLPKEDAEALTHGGLGRRISPIEPEESLLLKKPLLRVAHVGGKRLRKEEPEYRILRDWIAEGAKPDSENTAECIGITIFPRDARVLRVPDASQQVSVQARFSDGTVRDVTRLATYQSSSNDLLSCDAHGAAKATGRGVAAITIRYLSHVESLHFTIVSDTPGFKWVAQNEKNFIDEHVNARLKRMQFLPSARADDATFLRRVCIDLTGLPPTAEESRMFLQSTSPDKRSRVIDELLASDAFSRFWAMKDADLMRVSPLTLKDGRADLFAEWLHESWSKNQPLDEAVRTLLTAAGDTKSVGPANYFFAIPKSEDLAEATAQVFMGSRINCAKCHNHPFERWTQDDYYRLVAVFARTKNQKGTIVVQDAGEVKNPTTGATMLPWGSETKNDETAEKATTDRRDVFAEWLIGEANPYFSRVAVNRMWAALLGRGIVEPVDDFRSSNPATNPELLDALAGAFEKSGYDRRHIIRLICNSETYQRSAEANESNREDNVFFSRYVPRRLTAEQLHDAIGFATRTLAPPETAPDSLEQARTELNSLTTTLPSQFDAWEAETLAKLAAIPAWQSDWRRLGPFKAKNYDEAVKTEYDVEKETSFDFSRAYEDGKFKWKLLDGVKDGESQLAFDITPGPSYLARTIFASRPGKAVISLGTTGSLKIWNNGAVVFDNPDKLQAKADAARAEFDLVEGENRILMKIANAGGFFGWYYKLESIGGAAVPESPVASAISELIVIPRAARSAEQQKQLETLSVDHNPRVKELRDSIERLEDRLDYQTQRAWPEQSEFLKAFGQPKRETACACERQNAPTIDQALQTLNGEMVRERIVKGAAKFVEVSDDRALIEEMTLSCLGRHPKEREAATMLDYISQKKDRAAAVEDLLWSLVNTREFLFQH